MSKRISPTIHSNEEIDLDDLSQYGGHRPGSADSRTAWDNKAYDHGPDINTVSTNMYDYDLNDGSSDIYRRSQQSVSQISQINDDKSVLSRMKKGLRSLWGTRQTEDVRSNRELYIRTTIRELVMYIFFLVTLCILTFGMTSSTHFYYTKVMQTLFVDAQFPDTKNTFRGLSTMQDFWRFSEGPLMDGLFWESWYNNENLTENELGYIYYENKLLGVARIRQLKVRNGSCEVHPDFQEEITSCYDSYSKSKEDTAPFGPANGTAWVYHTEESLDGSGHWGLLDFKYGGGGYYQVVGQY